MKRLKALWKNERGAYSLIAAILVVILATCLTAYVDIVNMKWALNEVQSVMDSAGINTLQNQVNNKALRAEILSLSSSNSDLTDQDYADTNNQKFTPAEQKKYKEEMRKYYYEEIAKQIKTADKVVDYDVERVDITFSYDDWGLGDTTGKLPQITLESVVRMRVATTPFFDMSSNVSKTFYSSRNNANFTVTYNGVTEDGKTELIVRSVTRLVFR
jgi:uncharacterized membrane protein